MSYYSSLLFEELDKMCDDDLSFDSIIFVRTDPVWVFGPFFSKGSALSFYSHLSADVRNEMKPQAWISKGN